MILADQIRKYVLDKKINQARDQERSTVVIIAGEIHAEMGLENRMPAVCSALDAAKFLDYAQVRPVERSGPKYGSTAKWVFELNYSRTS